MGNDVLEIAKLCQFNEKAEAQAVLDYTEMIQRVVDSSLEQDKKDAVIDNIMEIVSDELNHQMRLGELYVMLTGIEPNKD